MATDQEELSTFLDEAQKILQKVVDWRGLLFREEMREPINAAWTEVKPSFDTVKSQIKSGGVVTDKLRNAGLTGPQLKMKLTGFRLALADFQQWGTIKLLNKVLGWINAILKSIVSAVPGGEAIVEFKEACEKAMEEEGGRVIPPARKA